MKKILDSRIIVGALMAACLLLLVISCLGCSGISTGINKVTDAFTNPAAREVYAREFKDDDKRYITWEAAFNAAQGDSVTVTLPYGEKGTFNPEQDLVYSYTVDVKEGEVLTAEIMRDSMKQRIFIDLYELNNSGYRHVKSAKAGEHAITHEPEKTGSYRVIIQPELDANSDFFITINKRALYAVFPVAGKGNGAIGSFWGVERDGGARKHEGIDIFAKKGTPVVAITDGYITFTGERGLGGKQVWLRDGLFGASLYYAHLDSIKALDGTRVKAGDTLGFVGNTGNARFTPPHLHFGIYRNFGAVDPLPFVYATEKISHKHFARSYRTETLRAKGKANLRQGPSTAMPVIGTVGTNETIILLGQSKDWLHIQTTLGKKAFISKTLVKA